jgi:tetratricopeptide (TPR) repeat protein
MGEKWFRRTSWTAADREAFFSRLRRSRTPYHKAQYLQIQAQHLHGLRRKATTRAALELLAVLLEEFPEPSQLAIAYLVRGDCLQSLGDVSGALESYRQALQAQRDFPKVSTLVHQRLAWLVATAPVPESNREALAALEEFGGRYGGGELVPINYRTYAAKALLHAGLGELTEAKKAAERALQLAERDHSGFGEAPTARSGLAARRVHARLKELATEQSATADVGHPYVSS